MSEKKTNSVRESRTRSFKSMAIQCHNVILNMHNNEEKGIMEWTDSEGNRRSTKLRVVFTTSSGVVTGDLPDLFADDPTGGEGKTYTDLFFRTLDLEYDRLEKESPHVSITSGGVIPLKNVQLQTNAGVTLNMIEFVLFTEDVTGFYFIPVDQEIV